VLPREAGNQAGHCALWRPWGVVTLVARRKPANTLAAITIGFNPLSHHTPHRNEQAPHRSQLLLLQIAIQRGSSPPASVPRHATPEVAAASVVPARRALQQQQAQVGARCNSSGVVVRALARQRPCVC
jgi:hypothetical protein